MFPPSLIPVILIAVLAGIALLIFIVPLDLSFLIEFSGRSAVLMIVAVWSIIFLKISYREGNRILEIGFLERTLYRKVIVPGPPSVPEIPELAADVRAVPSLIQALTELWPGIIRIFSALKRHIRFRGLSCDLLLGTGSPALTGLIFGAFSAVRPLLVVCDRVSLSLQPVFDREVLEGTCRIDLRIRYPLTMIVLLFRFFLSRGFRSRMTGIRHKNAGAAL
jgi:hypothetical protein